MAAEIHGGSDAGQGGAEPRPVRSPWLLLLASFLGTLTLMALLLVYPPVAVCIAAIALTWWSWEC